MINSKNNKQRLSIRCNVKWIITSTKLLHLTVMLKL